MKKQPIALVVCLLLGCSTGVMATVNPVAHWSFDNPLDLGHDDSGNGHNGNVVGATTSTAGSWGNAENFDGASYLNVADAPGLNPTSAITITAWFKADSFTSMWPNIVSKRNNDGSHGYCMEIQQVSEGNPCAGFAVELEGQGLRGHPVGVGVPKLNPGDWYFLAGVYDGVTISMNLYHGINDLSSLVVTSANYSGNIVPSSNDLMIGNANIYGSRSFDGAIDEVRIFDRAITSAEVKNLYLYNTPEPATLLLLGLGGLVLRKRK
jgi:hypothetical protein